MTSPEPTTAAAAAATMGGETLEQMQARHRKEQRELQGRITSKKKNATKKTRKFVNDECASLESQLRERQEEEVRGLVGAGQEEDDEEEESQQQQPPAEEEQPSSSSTDGLTAALKATSLSPPQEPSPAPQPPAQKQQQQQQQQPKRNRQKERLARRAAEQEAAAAAAEAEAASMPDRRAAERADMLAGFAARGLREVEIAPDGHCLFSAVADQLGVLGIPIAPPNTTTTTTTEGEDGGKPVEVGARGYKIVRGAAAGWIESHRGEYEGFLCGEEGGVEEYVRRIRETAEWGGEVELSALANAYGVEIRVVQGGGRVEVVKPMNGGGGGGEDGGEGKTLWLAYYRHGYGLGEHYNSLRSAKA